MSPAREPPRTNAPLASPALRPPSRGGFLGFLARLGLLATMLLWSFAFSPWSVAAATIPGFVAFLCLVERCDTRGRTVRWVAIAGAVCIGAGYRWLAPTVRVFGELDERIGAAAGPVSWAVLLVFGVAGSLHAVLFALAWRRVRRGGARPHPLETVLLFVAFETLPIRFLPWAVGHGAVDVGPLRQLAEWGGVPLVSIALLCFVVPVHEAIAWARGGSGAPARPRAAVVTLAVGLALFVAGAWRSSRVAARFEAAPTRRVAIVQANVGSVAKRRSEREEQDAARSGRRAYERGTRAAAAAGADLVVWPESALVEGIPLWDVARDERRSPRAVDADLAREGYGFLAEVGRDRTLLLGGYEDEVGAVVGPGAPRRRRNVAALRPAGGGEWSAYRKVRLLPFGESMPGSRWFPSLANLLPQGFRMVPGEAVQPPLLWRDGVAVRRVVAFVCYEAILPDVVADLVGPTPPDLLVNLTNDSWYGDTWEPHQHLAFSRFRAVEHGTPMVRATNTGISAFVSPTGEVLATLGVGREGVLVHDLPLPPATLTPYARTHHAAAWALWAVGLAIVLRPRRRGDAVRT